MKLLQIILALTLFITAITATSALPLVLNEVEIDDTILHENAVNRLSLERGQDYEVRIQFTPTQNLRNTEVRAFISGFEYNDIYDIEDTTPVFDADANVTYVKKLHVRIPDTADTDNYKLRVVIADRFGDERSAVYNLKIDVPRNALKIEDVIFNPDGTVRSGSALLTTVRIQNMGEREQRDVRVTVSIPGLGLSGTQYVEDIDNQDEEEQTEEIFLRIPTCAKAGTYDVSVDVEFMQRTRRVTEKKSITILEDETCFETAAPVQKTTISLGSSVQNVISGQTVIFPVTITNAARTSKTFALNIPSSDFASVTVTPTSMLVIPAGQTQTTFVNVLVSDDAPAGAQALVATITSGTSQEQVTFTANVLAQESSARNAFEIILVVLLVVLVILALALVVGYLRGKSNTQQYY